MKKLKSFTEVAEEEREAGNVRAIFPMLRVWIDRLVEIVNWLIDKVGDEEEIWNELVETSASQRSKE